MTGSLIGQRVRRKQLQGYVAAQRFVPGAVHHAHPAAAQLRDDPVVRKFLPNHAGMEIGRMLT
ncbi:MAG: hypothetical protein A2V91_02820 [Candidatus Muproteobacteria bacterium RBG_16_64_10]|uniref:Uncharacterized protein n=1 Tax=Candidatus Muproteobacteria bacterium RBG_16_64_10 TaxID=1817757 RepID=A0A1F6T588_9PROT|nr:MAG: hypothetical protein A2V91_02820 [Candidatus Muproteobacteria bacterium RBG_16_64_10]